MNSTNACGSVSCSSQELAAALLYADLLGLVASHPLQSGHASAVSSLYDVTWFERVDERRTLDVVLADLAYSSSFLP